MEDLVLEVNADYISDADKEGIDIPGIMITPAVGDDEYWLFRVKVSDSQSIIGFPKFGTIGIGFQKEKDWNTNLSYQTPANRILEHIRFNKGDDNISDDVCLKAIRLIQDAALNEKGFPLDPD